MTRPSRSLLVVILSLMMLTVAGADDDAGALLRTLADQLAAGRHAEALDTARRCAEILPGNPAVWYNLAGLEELNGHRDAAVAALRRAVQVGFDDFRHADGDEDLGDLRLDDAYGELHDAWAAGLAARTRARRLEVTAGRWSPWFALEDRRGGLDPPAADVRLRVTADHLDVEVRAEMQPVGQIPPWHGGTGLFAAVILPEDPRTGEGHLAVEFGVGMADGVPAGAVRLGRQWQRLAELTPKLRRDPDGGHLQVTFAIPWTLCGSLHPLVDDTLALNLIWRRADTMGAGRAAWLEDPAAGRTDRRWRRGIPVVTRWPADTPPVIAGRVTDRVITDGAVRLAPLAAAGSDGPVTVAVRDRTGALQYRETWPLAASGPVRRRTHDLALDLAAGSVRLGATLTTDAGDPVAWETNLVALPDGWDAATRTRIAAAPVREQPSLQYRLDAVNRALAVRHHRHAPTALGATVDELEAMLDRTETAGTSLPAGGSYLAATTLTGPGGPVLCSLSLPDGWRRGAAARVALLLARAPGQEQRAVLLAPRVLAERAAAGHDPAPLILAVAHLAPTEQADRARDVAAGLLDWLCDFVGTDTVYLAGVDRLAATALETAALRPAAVAATLLITGMDFAPYADLAPGALPAPLSNLAVDARVGWISFPDEQHPGDQTGVLQARLTDHGVILSPLRSIPGGLDFSQVWTRTVVWAAELTD